MGCSIVGGSRMERLSLAVGENGNWRVFVDCELVFEGDVGECAEVVYKWMQELEVAELGEVE